MARARFEHTILNFESPSLATIRHETAKMGEAGWELLAVDTGRLWFFFKRVADPLVDFEHTPQHPVAAKPVAPVVAPPKPPVKPPPPPVIPLLNRNKSYSNGAPR